MLISRSEFLKLLGLSAAGLLVPDPLKSLLKAEEMQSMPPTTAPLQGEYEVNANFVNHGPGFGRRIALTFDDGPTRGVTEIVLQELKKRDIKATFFMIGNRVLESPELAQRVYGEGHEIGNHTFTHSQLSKMSDDNVLSELTKCQNAIVDMVNFEPVWFRPPYGSFRHNQGPLAVSKGLGVTYWSVDPRDWSQPGAQRIIDTILSQTKPGSIVLMHDLHKQTAQALPSILDGLIERDFEFSTLSGFLGEPYA